MAKLSIAEQVGHMERLWPDFELLHRSSWWCAWEGIVTPLQRTYRLRVGYTLPALRDGVLFGFSVPNPSVVVEAPLLEHRGEEFIPHIFPNPFSPDRPRLCLAFHPEGEWLSSMPIAETTIPWACQWLDCYEGWRATGEWRGGGLHPGDAEWTAWRIQNRPDLSDSPPGRLEAGQMRALSSRGRRAAYSVSLASMEAASRGFSPLEYYHVLNSISAFQEACIATSIMSLEHLRAGL